MYLNRIESVLRLSAVRQALLLFALFICISIAGWGGTFLIVKQEMQSIVDARLNARMTETIAALDAGEGLPSVEKDETAEFVSAEVREGFKSRDEEGSSKEMRYLTRQTTHGRIRLGEETEIQEELRDILAGGMQISLLATSLFTALAVIWITRRHQRRLNTINHGLAAVAQGKLSARIDLDGHDDLSLLADRINGTTTRLEDLMTQMKFQSSNIAHDLRTPMARLRAQLEGSLIAATEKQQPITSDDLVTALEQIDGITGTFEALLRLARIESGAGRDAFAELSLGTLVEDVADIYGPVVEETGQTLRIEVTDPETVSGDKDLLVQLLANLIQNALQHGAKEQSITIRVHGPRLVISDEGPGILFEHRDVVFQPLHQGETTRQGEGYGLGLSLVRAIAELHDAEVSLSDGPNGQGLRVTVNFP